jgi:response regulator RpfG family c-di-GMP phosphodiesterase
MDNVNVLIIEDTSESDALSKVLANSYNLVGIAHFNEALKLFYANKVDVVIIDIFLNGSPDGISLDGQCNASKPFVFLTSSNDRQIFERANSRVHLVFLMKPFNELRFCML